LVGLKTFDGFVFCGSQHPIKPFEGARKISKSALNLSRYTSAVNPIPPYPSTSRDEIDLRRIVRLLISQLRFIALVPVVVGALGYLYFRMPAPTYSASVKLVAANNTTGNSTVNATLVSAPPLPNGTLDSALSSLTVLRQIENRVDSIEAATSAEKADLKKRLEISIRRQKASGFSLSGKVDDYSLNGNYTLRAEHGKPEVAAALANFASDALIDWDTQRALRTVNASRKALESAIKDIDSQLERLGPIGNVLTLQQRSLIELRTARLNDLNGVQLLSRAALGTLTVVAPAVPPLDPIAPHPSRDALILAFVATLLAILVTIVRATLVKARVESEADLRGIGLSEIARIPRIRNIAENGIRPAMTKGASANALQFVVANLNITLSDDHPKVIMVTSASPGEGKTSVTAALGQAFASSENRVLIVDADIRKPSQMAVWGDVMRRMAGSNQNLSRAGSNLQSALMMRDSADAFQLAPNLYLMPAFASNANTQVITKERFNDVLKRWKDSYDVILIDTPPSLLVADSLVIAPLVSGIVLVIEAGKTTQEAVARTLDSLVMTGARVLGAVLNKTDARSNPKEYSSYLYNDNLSKLTDGGTKLTSVTSTGVRPARPKQSSNR
jgi:capsular exopolysaccharide synthesis family protein